MPPKGSKHTKKSIMLMSLAKKGIKFTKEHRKKLSTAHKGKKLSKEHREKLCNKYGTPEERFWQKVKRNPITNCLEWTGNITGSGYGTMGIKGKNVLVHRFAYELYHNIKIPKGLFVCHHCDNKKCVEKTHLFIGTHAQNVADMVKKGRSAKGDKSSIRLHPESYKGKNHWTKKSPKKATNWLNNFVYGENNVFAKLTEKQVIEIRNKYKPRIYTMNQLANEYNVHPDTISLIIRRRTWKHI